MLLWWVHTLLPELQKATPIQNDRDNQSYLVEGGNCVPVH